MQLLMETDVEGMIGAGRHERTAERATYRNGYRDRTLDTRLGSLQLRIHPPLRRCVYGPKPNQGYTGITENEGIGETSRSSATKEAHQ